MMRQSMIALAIASAVVGGSLAYSKDASAWWTRQYGGIISSVKSGDRVFATRAMYPVLSTSSMPMTNAATINVETTGLRNDSRTSVQICAAHWSSSGTTCSPWQDTIGAGHVTFSFAGDEGVWNNAAHFPYVIVHGSAPVAAEVVRVNGIFIAN